MRYYFLLFYFSVLTSFAQDDITPVYKTAYLFIDENIDLNCQNYPYSKKFNKNHRIHKSDYDEGLVFLICRHRFIASKSDIEILSTEEFQKLNLWSFGQMQYERLRKGFIRFNDCFKAIYFIEKTGINEYKKYLVTWESARNMNRVDIDSRY